MKPEKQLRKQRETEIAQRLAIIKQELGARGKGLTGSKHFDSMTRSLDEERHRLREELARLLKKENK